MEINPRALLKSAIEKTGYRITNAKRRWGVDPIDDILKIVGDRNKVQNIFDVGANHGQSAILFNKRFPKAKITSFEPVKSTYGKLLSTTKPYPQIEAINCALGSFVGTSEITLFGDSGKSSLVGEMSDSLHQKVSGSETIQVTTLDAFLSTAPDVQIDFIKTDTEGFDLEVLKGAEATLKRSRITFILTEFHYLLAPTENRRLGSLEQLGNFLANFGYRFVTSYTDSVHDNEPVGTHNALFMVEKHPFRWCP